MDQSAGQTDVRQENNVGGSQTASQTEGTAHTIRHQRAAAGLGAGSSLLVVVGRRAVPGHFLN